MKIFILKFCLYPLFKFMVFHTTGIKISTSEKKVRQPEVVCLFLIKTDIFISLLKGNSLVKEHVKV